MANIADAESRIAEVLGTLNEHGKKLHEEAVTRGWKDEVCPESWCSQVFPAHNHHVRCRWPDTCPMITKQDRYEDGTPKRVLDTTFEQLQRQRETQNTEKEST